MINDFPTFLQINQNAPILDNKDYAAPSIFEAANMIREARRQKILTHQPVPEICILDPDGDLLSALKTSGAAERFEHWACYHTEMYKFTHGDLSFGIIGNAVGASFSVLLAEQAFACGARLLISLTSAGQIVPAGPAPYFILIERALRDEGTSYHYLPPSEFAEGNKKLLEPVYAALIKAGINIHIGASWTTDAPFRETQTAINAAHAEHILAVEMEAAALYAFAQAKFAPVLCFAQVTNQMAKITGDFEKGDANGACAALSLIVIAATAALSSIKA